MIVMNINLPRSQKIHLRSHVAANDERLNRGAGRIYSHECIHNTIKPKRCKIEQNMQRDTSTPCQVLI